MPVTSSAAAPAVPVPVESPVSARDLTAILIKHYGLHEGRFDLLVEYQIGVGPVGPDPASFVPGIMFGVARVGLMAAAGEGPTSVDAAVANPAPRPQKKAAGETPKKPTRKKAVA